MCVCIQEFFCYKGGRCERRFRLLCCFFFLSRSQTLRTLFLPFQKSTCGATKYAQTSRYRRQTGIIRRLFFILKLTFKKSKEAGRKKKKKKKWLICWLGTSYSRFFFYVTLYSEGDESHAGSNTHFNHFFPQFSPSSRPGRGESE